MKTPMLVALLLAAAPAFAVNDASFDQGVDVSALVGQAKDAAKKDTTVRTMSNLRYDSDCVYFSFAPNDGPVSDSVWLRSQEWETVCQPVGDPRHGGGQNCWERPGMSWSERVRITLAGRPPLLPWERDTFRICLQGPWIYTDQIETAYDYRFTSSRGDAGDLVATAGRRTPESPDPNGVSAALSGQLKVTFADKWSSYYAGEQIALKIELKKVVKFWPDATILEKEVVVPVAAAYAVDLNQYSGSFSSKPEAGKEYYVKYSIKRIGAVSRPDYTKKLETPKISYAPPVLASL
jgi:hypothetical protein